MIWIRYKKSPIPEILKKNVNNESVLLYWIQYRNTPIPDDFIFP